MLRKKGKYILLFCVVSLLISACVDDVDFSQGEDFAISPTLDASVIYFEEPASSFLDEDGLEQTIVKDSVNIEIFNDEFTVDNLTRAEFLFEVVNTINRSYQAQIDFLDATDALQHTFTFSVAESPDEDEIITEHLEVFVGDTLEALKRSIKLVITLTLMPSPDGSVLDENSPGMLRFRSKATFSFI